MGPSSMLDVPAPVPTPDAAAPGSAPHEPTPPPQASEVRQIAQAYASEVLLLPPGPTTAAIIDGAVHRRSGSRRRPVGPGKVHDAVREEAYRRQQEAARLSRRGTRSNRRVLVTLALCVLVVLAVAALAVGIRSVADESPARDDTPAVVRGRVETADGGDAARVLVTAIDPDGTIVAEVVTDEVGTFMIGDLSEGGYVLMIPEAGGQHGRTSTDVYLEPGDEVALTIVLDAP